MGKTEVIIVRSEDNGPSHSKYPLVLVLLVILFTVLLYLFIMSSQPSRTTATSENLQQNLTPAVCSKLTNSNSADQCWYTLALSLSNASYCGYVKQDSTLDQYPKDNCFAELAKQKNDSTLCEQINSAYWADKCWFEVAVETKNTSLCQNIISNSNIDPWTKDKCTQQIYGNG